MNQSPTLPTKDIPDALAFIAQFEREMGLTGNSSLKAKELEARGWRAWLTTLFPFAFEDEFSADHIRFWTLYWSILLRIREQRKLMLQALEIPAELDILEDEWVILLILGRGLGKSSTIEASAVMRGAILEGGYCLYISEAQDQAEEHIGNCKILIDHEESRLTEFYPSMTIDENATVDGMKVKDSADIFITRCGWICRAKGLNSKLRGLRKGGRRPDDINIDDIDGVNDSIAVSLKKLKQLASSVIPTQARRFATIKFGQNLIAEESVMNRIFCAKSDALSARTVVGVTNTFEKFIEHEDFETYLDEKENRLRHRILPNAKPTWDGVDIPQAQKFLNDSGLETFLAEYQNEFEHLKTEKVVHEYSEDRHVITWSQFEKVFGSRFIPQHWRAAVGADIGYSKQSLSAWSFVATSAQNTPLPAHYFQYRSLTFSQDSIDNQAFIIWQKLFPDIALGKRHFEASQTFRNYPELERLLKSVPACANLLNNYNCNPINGLFENRAEISQSPDEINKYYLDRAKATFNSQIVSWRISHEKTGEQITLAQKYGLPIEKTKHFGATSGVAELNHLLRGDFTRPHPFLRDEKLMDENGKWNGLYRLGSPFLYFVVDDDQASAPRDDRGMKIAREQISQWRYTQEKLTESGLTKTIPMKYMSDANDALRMITAEYKTAFATPLTEMEKIELTLPNILRAETIREDQGLVTEAELNNRRLAREIKLNFENPLKNREQNENVQYWGDLYK